MLQRLALSSVISKLLYMAATLILAATVDMPPALNNCKLNEQDGACFTDIAGRRVVFLDAATSRCQMIADRHLVGVTLKELSRAATPPYVLQSEQLSFVIAACKRRDARALGLQQPNRPRLMFPGTKWCGPGDEADSFDDLGELREVDACCRDHDQCPDNIKPQETKHNITNDSGFTMSHCDCDDAFRSCLTAAGGEAAEAVGLAYFSTGFIKCFRLAPPVVACVTWSGFFRRTCQEYKFNSSEELQWQVFDLANF